MKSLDLSIILKLVDKVTAPLKGVVGGFGKVKGSADAAIASVSRFERVSAAVQRTTDRLSSMVGMAGKASAALAAVGGVGVGALATNATNVTADFESMGVVLDVVYHGNEEQIGKAKGFLKDFMAESPFETANILEGFNRLKGSGIDPMNGSLKTLGDTAAAKGKTVMDAVEMMADAVMGQNERLLEFDIRGTQIQGTDYIQYEYTDKNGIQQKLQVLKNDRAQIQRVLTQILNDNYGGAQAKLAKTWKGLTSNTKDALNNLQMQFMNAGLFDFMKDGLQDKLNMITELSKSGKVEEWGKKAADFMRLASTTANQLKDDVWEAATKLSAFVGGWENLGKIGAGAAGLWLFRDVIFAVGAGVGLLPLLLAGVTASLVDWRKLLPDIQDKIKAVFQQFQNWGGFPKLKAEGLPLIQAQVANLKVHFNRLMPLFEQGAEKALAFGKRVASALAGLDLGKALPALTFAFSLSPFKLLTSAGKELWAVFEVAFDSIRGHLPLLRQQFGDVFGVIGRYLSDNAGTVRATISGVLVAAFDKLSQGLAWLSGKARDGSLRGWLDAAAQKIPVVMDNVLAFGKGVWDTVLKIGGFVSKFAEFIGGWDKLAMVLAGGWVIAALSGFLQGLGALLGIITFLASPIGLLVALIVGLAIGARYAYLEWDNMSTKSKALVLAIGAIGLGILGYVAYLKLAAMWTAFQLTPIGAWIAGLSLASVWAGISAAATWVMTAATSAFGVAMAIVTSPITLVIAAIAALAAGAYYLYQNWDTVKPMLLAFWEDVKAAWETFKTWVGGLVDTVLQVFSDGWTWLKTETLELTNSIVAFFAELPAKMLEVGGNIITGLWDGLKGSASAVVDWMEGFGSDIIDSAKGILGINSPSRVFAEIGGFTVDGMKEGMETAQPKLFSFLDGFGDKLKGWWKGVADAFTGDDLVANIGKAFEATKNALPSLPAPVTGALAAVLPGGSLMSAVGQVFSAAKKAPHINPASADASVISGMPTVGRISSEYGMRTHPITGKQKMHAGIDIAAAAGTAVASTGVGTVAFMGKMSGYGNTVIVQHDKGIQTLYAHLKDFEGGLSVGKAVQKGQRLGGVGNTGASTGNHLHYEVRQAAMAATQAVAAPLGAVAKSLGGGFLSAKKAGGTFDAVQAALAFSAPSRLTGMDDAQTRAYAANTMQTESGGRVGAVNSYGFSGQYQFGADALAENGLVNMAKLKAAKASAGKAWYDGGYHKAFLANASNWDLQGGQAAFLANKALQDQKFVEYTNRNIQAGIRSGAIRANDDPAKIAAYAKAAHLKGAGGANKLFLHGADSRDAYGTSTASYAQQAREAIKNLAPVVQQKLVGTKTPTTNLPPKPVWETLQATPTTNRMPPAIQDLQAMAANDPLFAQALSSKPEGEGVGKLGERANVVPFARPAPASAVAPQQTITITINAAPGMDAQDIAAEVQRVLREEARRKEARQRGRMHD